MATTSKMLICPYCGEAQRASDRCRACGGLFEALSRQATHNAMGPWYVRDSARPFQPGCSYETIVRLIERGRVTKTSIIRGPTTKQFWTVARRVPGLSHLFGYCHHCESKVEPSMHGCPSCGVPFGAYLDRDYLGLPEIRPLPWEADVEEAAVQSGPGARPLALAGGVGGGLTGLSSFATDEELLGGQRTDEGAEARESPPAGPAAVAPPAPPVRTVAAAEPERAAASTRTLGLQRRLERQARQVRTLIVCLAVAGVVIVALGISTVRGLGGGDPAPAIEPPASTPAASEAGRPGGPAEPAAGDPTAPATGSPASEAGGEPGLRAPTGPVDSRAAATEPAPDDGNAQAAPPWHDALIEVDELVARAEDQDRAAAERIAAYEEAQAALDHAAAAGLPEQQLRSRRQRYERAAERLRLREFFP
jgi:hypothetical protein